MHLTFHGAARNVTGSKHLLTLKDGRKILLDCGMFQGCGPQTASLNANFGFQPAEVSLVLLSHAHIDHSGLLPKLVQDGYTGKIYCTPATLDLTDILLTDSASIQESEAKDEPNGRPPLYTIAAVRQTMEQMHTLDYGQWHDVLPGVSVLFTHTGHLIGSAAIHLRIEENGETTTISYSGDVGRARHPLLKPAETFPASEYLILESTYGDKTHPLGASAIDLLYDYIKETCIRKKGKLVIAAFSVGRTQELLYLLNQLELEKRLPELNYYVDSPLSGKATRHMKQFTDQFNERLQQILTIDDDPFAFKGLHFVDTVEDSIRLTEYKEPCVIIAASGTADAGRVRHHIKSTVEDESNTILFSGYCSSDSFGGQLMGGARTVELFGKTYNVRASVSQMTGMSAHGDCHDLCQFIQCQDPANVRAIFLVHGEYRVQQALAERLMHKDYYPVYIPEPHQEYSLKVATTKMDSAQVDEKKIA